MPCDAAAAPMLQVRGECESSAAAALLTDCQVAITALAVDMQYRLTCWVDTAFLVEPGGRRGGAADHRGGSYLALPVAASDAVQGGSRFIVEAKQAVAVQGREREGGELPCAEACCWTRPQSDETNGHAGDADRERKRTRNRRSSSSRRMGQWRAVVGEHYSIRFITWLLMFVRIPLISKNRF